MSTERHTPMRRCAACRAVAPKRELLRFVRDDGRFLFDPQQRAGGRGTSICLSCASALRDGGDRSRQRGLQRLFGAEAAQVALDLEPHLTAASLAAAPALRSATTNGGMHG